MTSVSGASLAPVLYLPHGGGPLPLLGDKGHESLVDFMASIAAELDRPEAILVISAHWEETEAVLTSGLNPPLIYDYSGFPPEAYKIQYPAPGEPALAQEIHDLLQAAGIDARLDQQRGFDHGMFVPLKIMFPEADIPCVQLSLFADLDPMRHIALGKAIKRLRYKKLLVIGSGLSFHNLPAFFASASDKADNKAIAFDQWLVETCVSDILSSEERERRLVAWDYAPYARYCHPREEHLLPLHVCFGIACADTPQANLVFNQPLMGKMVASLLWWR